jgi:2-polyprenyl-6-hydroxyphenyl methylase/3-demethylubiquinone-9 3-methyltransferase
MVTIGEKVIRLLPSGTHDPAMFIRPGELHRELEATGFSVGRFVGFGPRGLNSRLDFTFGLLPTLAIQYLGHATASVRAPGDG